MTLRTSQNTPQDPFGRCQAGWGVWAVVEPGVKIVQNTSTVRKAPLRTSTVREVRRPGRQRIIVFVIAFDLLLYKFLYLDYVMIVLTYATYMHYMWIMFTKCTRLVQCDTLLSSVLPYLLMS